MRLRSHALSPSDRLTLAWLCGLAVLALATDRSPRLLAALAISAAALVAVAQCGSTCRAGRVAHDFFPIAAVPIVFNLAGPVIAAANPARWDPLLAAADARLFGVLAHRWQTALGRPSWLTDAASIAYVAFYFFPVGLAVWLYRDGRRREFDAFVFAVMCTFFLSYVGYLLFPAAGPRVPVERENQVIGGGAIAEAIRAALRVAEMNRLDAFPSGHTAVSLVVVGAGWRLIPRARAALVAMAGAIVFATVYLSLHYVVDVAAGALLAALMPVAIPVLRRLIAGKPRDPGRPGTSTRPSSVYRRSRAMAVASQQ